MKEQYTAKEMEQMQWVVIDKEIAEAKASGNCLSRRFVLDALLKEQTMKCGDILLFTAPHPAGGTWTFRVQKGNVPFFSYTEYKVWGIRNEPWQCGTHQTFTGGYDTLEDVFLDCLNHHNRNAAIKDRYQDLREWLVA